MYPILGYVLDWFLSSVHYDTILLRDTILIVCQSSVIKGFFLNDIPTKFKGVCNHHDLGPLGAAVNESALRHQVSLLKEMGANAIRTAHNMPAPELVRICDEMGMMLMVEPFDDWGFRPKSENGYGKFFNEWAQRDVTNMVKQYRSNPSLIILWFIIKSRNIKCRRVAIIQNGTNLIHATSHRSCSIKSMYKTLKHK